SKNQMVGVGLADGGGDDLVVAVRGQSQKPAPVLVHHFGARRQRTELLEVVPEGERRAVSQVERFDRAVGLLKIAGDGVLAGRARRKREIAVEKRRLVTR